MVEDMSKVMKKEIVESKKNNYTLILIVFFVFVIGIGVGYIVAKKDILKTIKDNSIGEKVEKDKKTKEQERCTCQNTKLFCVSTLQKIHYRKV